LHVEYQKRIHKLANKYEITEKHIYESTLYKDLDKQFKQVNEKIKGQIEQLKSLNEDY
jgi:hypothetical protein